MRSRVPQRLASDERLVSLVRRGDGAAFEALYDRYAAGLLSYCFFMLGSREDAEDAVQSTFAAAYGALLRDQRRMEVRPWLFAIARNACIGTLRKRRPREGERPARLAGEDLFAKIERRESVRQLLADVLELPERHRSALLLAELHGRSQHEIGQLLGVSPSTVKSYIFQARATLTSERAARETACDEIRAELATARGAALLRGRLRRHLHSCADCREYANNVARRRREFGALLPLMPTLALKRRVLDVTAGQTVGTGVCAGGAGTGIAVSGAIELGGAGVKTLLAKALIGATGLAAGAGAGTLAIATSFSAPTARVPDHTRGVELAWSRRSGRPGTDPASLSLSSRNSAPQAARPPASAEPAPGPAAGAQASVTASRVAQGHRGAAAVAGSKSAVGVGQGGDVVTGGGGHDGKAKGHGEEHGNSAAAHAGANGKEKSAEHGHAQGKSDRASHENSGNRGGTARGNGGNGRALGHGGSGDSSGGGNGNSAAHGSGSPAATKLGGQGNGNPHAASGPPSTAVEPGSAAVAGSPEGPHAQPGRSAEAPEGPPRKETNTPPGASSEHGSQAAPAHEPPGHTKG